MSEAANGEDGAAGCAELARMRIVLVRPHGAANLGAVARAMKNMGMRDLCLVAPRARRSMLARAMAVHARDVLEGAHETHDIATAVGDCQLVVGTTCRGGPYRAAAEDLVDAAGAIVAAAQAGTVALLFGPEAHGLTNEDLQRCQRLVSINTDSAYASLNLAQAVLLCCYELRRAAVIARPDAERRAAASAAEVERMLIHLQHALLKIGFLLPENPAHIMLALRQLFGRTTLDEREVRILLGLARQIDWYAGAHRPPSDADNTDRAHG